MFFHSLISGVCARHTRASSIVWQTLARSELGSLSGWTTATAYRARTLLTAVECFFKTIWICFKEVSLFWNSRRYHETSNIYFELSSRSGLGKMKSCLAMCVSFFTRACEAFQTRLSHEAAARGRHVRPFHCKMVSIIATPTFATPFYSTWSVPEVWLLEVRTVVSPASPSMS